MRPNDRQKFAAIVTGFAELKGKALSAAALDLYWAAMQQWSIEDFTAAALVFAGPELDFTLADWLAHRFTAARCGLLHFGHEWNSLIG